MAKMTDASMADAYRDEMTGISFTEEEKTNMVARLAAQMKAGETPAPGGKTNDAEILQMRPSSRARRPRRLAAAAVAAGLGSNLRREVLPSADIVTGVADHRWLCAQLFPATAQAGEFRDMGQTLGDGLTGEVELRTQDVESGEHRVHVLHLIVTAQFAVNLAIVGGSEVTAACSGAGRGADHLGLVLGKDDGRLALARLGFEDGTRLRHVLSDYHRCLWLDDTGFLAGYLGQRVA